MQVTCFDTVELSDIGRKRKNNEDACLRIPEKGVYCVADGMGGVVGGHLASAAIVSRLRKVFIESPSGDPESFAGTVKEFRQAVSAANRWIRDFAEEKVIGQMGSTVVAIVFDPNNPKRAVGLHAGDSRLYRYRNGQLQLLTADHTAAAALAKELGRDQSQIPEKFHNELVKAVGLAEKLELEKSPVDVASGDIFLLCSDGLTRMVNEEAIGKTLAANRQHPLTHTAQALIQGANEAGGKDNVTVILIKMGDLSGFSDAMEPVDLDTRDTSLPPAENEPVTRTGQGRSDTAEHNNGDTPSDDFSARARGETPNTVKDAGPPTPPTLDQLPAPKPQTAPAKKKSSIPVGIIAGAVLVLVVIGGLFLRGNSGRSSKTAAPDNTTQAPSTSPAPVPISIHQSSGTVQIESDPPGASVWLGDQSQGSTPLSLELQPGPAHLVVKYAGLRDQIANLTITAGKTIHLNAPFEYGGAVIHSVPDGATLSQNGQYVGFTPFTNGLLMPGRSTWQISATGYRTVPASVDVVNHKTNVISVTLQKEP